MRLIGNELRKIVLSDGLVPLQNRTKTDKDVTQIGSRLLTLLSYKNRMSQLYTMSIRAWCLAGQAISERPRVYLRVY
jgi:hypothetical protein